MYSRTAAGLGANIRVPQREQNCAPWGHSFPHWEHRIAPRFHLPPWFGIMLKRTRNRQPQFKHQGTRRPRRYPRHEEEKLFFVSSSLGGWIGFERFPRGVVILDS